MELVDSLLADIERLWEKGFPVRGNEIKPGTPYMYRPEDVGVPTISIRPEGATWPSYIFDDNRNDYRLLVKETEPWEGMANAFDHPDFESLVYDYDDALEVAETLYRHGFRLAEEGE